MSIKINESINDKKIAEMRNDEAQHLAKMAQRLEEMSQELNSKSNLVQDKSRVTKLLEAKKSDHFNINLLAELASKVQNMGINISQKLAKSGKAALMDNMKDMMPKDKNNKFEDLYDVAKWNIKAEEKQKLASQDEGKSIQQGKDATELINKYADTYAQLIVGGTVEFKKKLDELEENLKKKDVSEKKIIGVRRKIKNVVRKELMGEIKEAFLKKILSPKKTLQWVMNSKGLNDVVKFAQNNKELGGLDFGGYNGGLQGTANRAIDEAREELNGIISELLENKMMERQINKEETGRDVKDLIVLATKLGINLVQVLINVKAKYHHLGLAPVNIPLNPNSSNGGFREKQQDTGYEFTISDEKEILLNQLRAVYMQRALSDNYLTALRTSFKMRKLKNGLIKLGLVQEELQTTFEKTNEEGVALARLKLLEMLEEALRERATLYKLAGPAFKLIEKKIKGILRNLKNLGLDMDGRDFVKLRDKANSEIHTVATGELRSINTVIESRPHPGYEKRQRLLGKLILRLNEESSLDIPADLGIDEIILRDKSDLGIISEAA